MKPASATARECAAAVLEAVPHLMRVLRERVRSESSPELSMPQFRALAFIGRNADAMLSDVATFLGTPLPTASKLVDGLVAAGLAARETRTNDRRRMALRLTTAGRRKYDSAVKSAEAYLAARIGRLPADERGGILRAMETLHAIFDDPSETAARDRSL